MNHLCVYAGPDVALLDAARIKHASHRVMFDGSSGLNPNRITVDRARRQ